MILTMTLTKIISAAVVTSALLISSSSCLDERDTKVSVEGGNPPKFIISGSGALAKLRIGGPKKLREGIAEEPYIYWEIKMEKTDSERSIEALSPITYGDVPRGYIQVYPDPPQSPPPLSEDEQYQVNIVTMNANGARLNFAIHKGKVVANPTIRDRKPVFIARYYSTAQGRFTSPDPGPPNLSDPQIWNRYAYCGNDPLNYVNPDGLYRWGASLGGSPNR